MNTSIAIDGPAGAGKSTIAKIIANKLNLMYINTGSMYRAVTFYAIKNNISTNNITALCNLIDSLEMHFKDEKLIVNNIDISKEIIKPNISNTVSNYAKIPQVRQKLVYLQKKIAKKYNVIMDGRDIGTIVLNNATYKFFLTASPEKRAERRYNELINKGFNVNYSSILKDIIKRDYIDSNRKINPLIKAKDAIEIDSSNLNINQVVEKIIKYIKGFNSKKFVGENK